MTVSGLAQYTARLYLCERFDAQVARRTLTPFLSLLPVISSLGLCGTFDILGLSSCQQGC